MILSATIYSDVLTAIMRYLAPVFALLILIRCGKPMLFFRGASGNGGLRSYSVGNLAILTAFQLLCALSYALVSPRDVVFSVILGFGGLILCQWGMLTAYFYTYKTCFDMETIAFFLSTLGMCAICTVCPGETGKQILSMGIGIALFFVIGWWISDLERAKKTGTSAAVAGVGFLMITLLFGKEFYGAKNWLMIGAWSVQPSELSKVCFVLAVGSGMDRRRKNMLSLIFYTVLLCLCLALMNDLGTALIFFVAFLVAAYLHSGSVGTVALSCVFVGFAGAVLLKIAPHALRRFTTWRHIWENPLTSGFQQTRALMCMASGGLFGLGAGRGLMKDFFSADSDMVVAVICEEWGLLTVFIAILMVAALGVFAVRSASNVHSTIGAVTAAAILVFQTMLNALGTMDILPLTGVTFPFVSNGGSSMVCVWGLLAFIKATDTRQNSSKKGRKADG